VRTCAKFVRFSEEKNWELFHKRLVIILFGASFAPLSIYMQISTQRVKVSVRNIFGSRRRPVERKFCSFSRDSIIICCLISSTCSGVPVFVCLESVTKGWLKSDLEVYLFDTIWFMPWFFMCLVLVSFLNFFFSRFHCWIFWRGLLLVKLASSLTSFRWRKWTRILRECLKSVGLSRMHNSCSSRPSCPADWLSEIEIKLQDLAVASK